MGDLDRQWISDHGLVFKLKGVAGVTTCFSYLTISNPFHSHREKSCIWQILRWNVVLPGYYHCANGHEFHHRECIMFIIPVVTPSTRKSPQSSFAYSLDEIYLPPKVSILIGPKVVKLMNCINRIQARNMHANARYLYQDFRNQWWKTFSQSSRRCQKGYYSFIEPEAVRLIPVIGRREVERALFWWGYHGRHAFVAFASRIGCCWSRWYFLSTAEWTDPNLIRQRCLFLWLWCSRRYSEWFCWGISKCIVSHNSSASKTKANFLQLQYVS